MVLQRGNQRLPIRKLADRLTIRLVDIPPNSTAQSADRPEDHLAELWDWLAPQIKPRSLDWIAPADLILVQVEPTQLEQAFQILRSNPAIAFASHAYALAQPETPVYLSDQITVQFAPETPTERMQTITAAAGLQILKLVPGVAKAFVFQLTAAAENPLKLADRLSQSPEIWLAEPEIIVPVEIQPSDVQSLGVQPLEQLLEQLHPDPLPRRRSKPNSNTIAAWQSSRGDRAIVVAVVAAGLDLDHPEFSGEGKVVAPLLPRTAARPNRAVTLPTQTAPDCALMPICLDRYLSDRLIEQVCEWLIDRGADVVYWGLPIGILSLRQRMAIARAASQGRQGRGCVMITDVAPVDRLPSSIVHPDVLRVAPCNLSPDDQAQSEQAVALVVAGEDAGAIAAGVAALVLSVNPGLTAAEVRQILQTTADKMQPDKMQPDTVKPIANPTDGLDDALDYDAIGYSPRFGYGRLNAQQAVAMAARLLPRLPLLAEWQEFTSDRAIAIPDYDPQGAISPIQVSFDRQVLDLEVEVSLEHAFVGDLEIWLRSPNGAAVLLQNRGLGRLESLRKTYTQAAVPGLRRSIGQTATGLWQLQVIDRAPTHTGRLERWTLRIGI